MVSLRVGLIGYPVGHSLSPPVQQAALDALGIDARYELWSTPEGEIVDRIQGLREPDALGASVTLPYKGIAFDLVDEVSELAQQAGAVNTIVNRGGRLLGDNTDIPGFMAPLLERAMPLAETQVVILGAGGAARGVAVGLLNAGCPRIIIANRTSERAARLIETLGGDPRLQAAAPDASLSTMLVDTTLLVNATAVGWHGDEVPIDPALLDALPENALVYDLTYRDTALLVAAKRRRLATIDGLPMLVHQAVVALRLWTGQEPPFDAMWAAALAARASSH